MTNEEIIKVIKYVGFWPRGVSTRHFYNLIFTNKRIIWEFVDKNNYYFRFIGVTISFFKTIKRRKKIKEEIKNNNVSSGNIDQILNKNLKNFILDYYGIKKVEIKSGGFNLELVREYPLIKKSCSFSFPKQLQYDVESVFLRKLPGKTEIKK